MAGTPTSHPSHTTPTIRISNSSATSYFDIPTRTHGRQVYDTLPERVRVVPMSIPNARDSPPPPLPPPRHIEEISGGHDPGWHFANKHRSHSIDPASSSVKPGSSLLGGGHARPGKGYSGPERAIDFSPSPGEGTSKTLPGLPFQHERRGDSSPYGVDEKIPDLKSLLEYNKLKSERQMGQQSLERTAQAYDKQLLSRIGGPRTPPRSSGQTSSSMGTEEQSPTSRSSSHHENNQASAFKKFSNGLRPLSMPERRHSDMGASGAPWSSVAGGNAGHALGVGGLTSPGFSGLRSPLSEYGAESQLGSAFAAGSRVLPPSRTSTFTEDTSSLSGRMSHRDSYDHSVFQDNDFQHSMGSPGMQELAIHDRSPEGSEDYQVNSRAGQKRRAQSPPSDGQLDPRLPSSTPGGNTSSAENWQKRPMQAANTRNSQPSRLNQSSLSSTASSALKNGAGSYASSFGTNVSNVSTAGTSYGSEHVTPNSYQHQNDGRGMTSPLSQVHSPLPGMPPPQPSNQNPPATLTLGGHGPPLHRRTTSSGILRAPGLWICDCCPKKPKKFESEEDLRVHEMEKQYICQYCHNRFKNKNEAERHQNSLHLRLHSWSCAALTSFEAAFHPTPNTSVQTALAAQHNPAMQHYQGGATATDTCGYCGLEFENPPNWDQRVQHLNLVHKFGECNQSKKFYRADHFRQHLKHSHAGTSGKWTNMLENACMKDEPPPQPLQQQNLTMPMHGIMVGPQGSYPASSLMARQHQQDQMQHNANQQHGTVSAPIASMSGTPIEGIPQGYTSAQPQQQAGPSQQEQQQQLPTRPHQPHQAGQQALEHAQRNDQGYVGSLPPLRSGRQLPPMPETKDER